MKLLNRDWSIVVDNFGYSDLAFDERPGFEGREYLSGEWATAVAFTRNAVTVGPTWLNPQFIFPDWETGSDFIAERAIGYLAETNRSGFRVAQSVIANGALRITITSEMIDTTNGIPAGLSPRSSASGSSLLSDRYVLRHSFAITNLSGQTLTSLRLFKFLHSLQATRAVYDDRSYGPTFNGHHYTITQQGNDIGENRLNGLPAVHSDTVAFHANLPPSGWEVGRFGIEGIDDHGAATKPSVGVHWSVESGTLSGLDTFGPTNRWVSGALQFDLGTLAPNGTTNIEFLLSLRTVTAMKEYKAVAWGDNSSHQAEAPASATNLTAIAAGGRHSLALRADGQVLAWGDNSLGQTTVPAGLSNVVAIAAGANHNLALREDGKVFAWGDHSSGQLNVPGTLAGVEQIAAGATHSLALSNGVVVGWGNNSFGQLDAPPLVNVYSLAAGSNFSLALQIDGTIDGWGDNSRGQLQVPTHLAWPMEIAAGPSYVLARDWDGTLEGWGDNTHGQLNVPAGLEVRSMAAGGGHCLALDYDGNVVGWGANARGQATVPAGLAGVRAVAAGGSHSLALVPLPPQLELVRTSQGIALSWSAAWAPELEPVVLQQASAVRGASWSPVTAAGSIDQGRYVVMLPLDSGAKFYRLRIDP